MPRTPRTKKPKGNKKVAYHLIDRDSVAGRPLYQQLHEASVHHPDLKEARIALAFCSSWKQDVDGRVVVVKLKRTSELDREFAAFDYVLLLRKAFWEDILVSREQRIAMIDHGLAYAAPARDPRTLEQLRDERGRLLWRLRKPDIVEFSEVVERQGCYTRDIERFYAALRRSALKGFEACEKCRDTPTPGYQQEGDRLRRCECWAAWQARVSDARPSEAVAV